MVSFSPSTNIARAIATCYLLSTSTALANCILRDSILYVTIIGTGIHGDTSTALKMALLLVESFLRETCHIQCSLTADSTRSSQWMLVKVAGMDNYA